MGFSGYEMTRKYIPIIDDYYIETYEAHKSIDTHKNISSKETLTK